MNGFIFISKIFADNTDYDKIEPIFTKAFESKKLIEKCCNKIFHATLFEKNILLINGKDFQNCFTWKKENNEEFPNEDSYNKLIKNIKTVYEEIKEKSNDSNQEFEDVFKPNETIICIHWGGSSNENEAMNKVLENLSKKEKSEELFSITYFTSGDGIYYKNLTKDQDIKKEKIEENIKTAFEFYKMRAKNLLVKKKIYELMESIFIYGFDFYLKQTSKQFSIEKTIDSKFFNEISEDINLLKTVKKCLYHQNTKEAIDSFFSLLKEEGDERILVPNIQTFRLDTYVLLNQIEGPIYPKAL